MSTPDREPAMSVPDTRPVPPDRIRWWPVPVILGLATLVIVWIWSTHEHNQQARNLRTAIVSLSALTLLFVWWLAFSRLRWRTRLIGAVLYCLVWSGAGAMFRIRGVSGDLLPQFEWRWHSAPAPALGDGAPAAQAAVRNPPRTNSSDLLIRDYPQFLGPQRNATVEGVHLARDWHAQPPELRWSQSVGAAWSGFAVARGCAVTQEQHGGEERIVCYELLTGRRRWAHADPARYFTTLGGEGPRATPTIDGENVYALGATGILNCLALEDGRSIWSKHVLHEHRAEAPSWGMSGSPLVCEDKLIVCVGGADGRGLVAYNKTNGAVVWSGGNYGVGYGSPNRARLGGVDQILIFHAGGIAGHAPDSGAMLWEHPWPSGHPHVAMPVVFGEDRVLVASGYGTGSAALRISRGADGRWSAERLWKTTHLKAKFTNPVLKGDYVYGLDDGILACVEAASGRRTWKEGRYGHGQGILAGDLLLVTAENGEVVLLEPNPQGLRELGRFTAFRRKTWNPPALAGQLLLVRNDQEAACYRLPLQDVEVSGQPDPIR